MSTTTAPARNGNGSKPANETPTDPLPTPVAIAHQRAEELINAISGGAKGQVRIMRDELDDLARCIDQREAALKAAITEHAALSASVYEVRDIIAPAIAGIRENFAAGLAPVPRTITADQTTGSAQRAGNQHH